MTCSSTYPCPLCLARKGLLGQTGDARTWEEVITLCEQWRLETGEDPDERKNYGCCHNVPLLGPTSNTRIIEKVVPPPLHITLGLNNPLRILAEKWGGLGDWLKSIHVDYIAYHGGKDLGNIEFFFNIMQCFSFFGLHPSTKIAIPPLLVDQIEKFQGLELSTAPKLSTGIFRCHVARVTCPQTWLKVSEL